MPRCMGQDQIYQSNTSSGVRYPSRRRAHIAEVVGVQVGIVANLDQWPSVHLNGPAGHLKLLRIKYAQEALFRTQIMEVNYS